MNNWSILFKDKRTVINFIILIALTLAIPLGIKLVKDTTKFFPQAQNVAGISVIDGDCVVTRNGKKVLICGIVPLKLVSPVSPTPSPTATPQASTTASPAGSGAPTTLANGLVSYWKMDELTGDTVGDAMFQSANSNGTALNAAVTEGKMGKGRSIGATNSQISVTNIGEFGGNLMSVAGFIKPTTFGANNTAAFFNKPEGASLEYAPDGNGEIQCTVKPIKENVPAAITAKSTAKLVPNVWSHIACVFNGTDLTVYINGAMVASAQRVGTLNHPIVNQPVLIGKSITSGQSLNASVDEIGYWGRALTDAEVQQLASGVTPFSTTASPTPQASTGPLTVVRVTGNNSTAIQAALNQVKDSGGAVYVPAGTYTVTEKIRMFSNVTLFGDGIDQTILQLDASLLTNEDGILANDTNYGHKNIVIRDMTFKGLGQESGMLQCCVGIKLRQLDGGLLYNLKVEGFSWHGIWMVYKQQTASSGGSDTVKNVRISHSQIINNKGDGIAIDSPSSENVVDENTFSGNNSGTGEDGYLKSGAAISLSMDEDGAVAKNKILKNTVSNNGFRGISVMARNNITTIAQKTIPDNAICNNTVENNADAGIVDANSEDSIYIANKINNNNDSKNGKVQTGAFRYYDHSVTRWDTTPGNTSQAMVEDEAPGATNADCAIPAKLQTIPAVPTKPAATASKSNFWQGMARSLSQNIVSPVNAATVPAGCSPRPNIKRELTLVSPGKLKVVNTVGTNASLPGNLIKQLRFLSTPNVKVTIGDQTDKSGTFVYDVPNGGATTVTYELNQVNACQSGQANLVLIDQCGDFSDFQGAGSQGWQSCVAPTPVPSSSPSPVQGCTSDGQCNNLAPNCWHYQNYPGQCLPDTAVCAQVITRACHDRSTCNESGGCTDVGPECVDFPNPCVVPPGWYLANTNTTPAPSGSPGVQPSASPSPTGASYRLAETEEALKSAQWKPYDTEPLITNFTLASEEIGQKTIWVEFISADGRTAKDSVTIEMVEKDPLISSVVCSLDIVKSNVKVTTIGERFGTAKGKLLAQGSETQVLEWLPEQVTGLIKSVTLDPKQGNTYKIKLQRADNQLSQEIPCQLDTSLVSLGAKIFCREEGKYDVANVKVTIYPVDDDSGASSTQTKKVEETVTIDKDGIVQGLKTKLEKDKQYVISIKAPNSLRKNTLFTASEGTTAVSAPDGKPFILPVGDIAPTFGVDGKINSLDQSELFRQWRVLGAATKALTGDFNRDTKVNSIDCACMKYDFNGEDEPLPTTENGAGGSSGGARLFFESTSNQSSDPGLSFGSSSTTTPQRRIIYPGNGSTSTTTPTSATIKSSPSPAPSTVHCGGIAGIQCPVGFRCQTDPQILDDIGTCVSE